MTPAGADPSAVRLAEVLRELEAVRAENELLREEHRRTLDYIRAKTNQLLEVVGTVPLRSEELDDTMLVDLDPIGIVGESFVQILEHLHDTNRELEVAHGELEAIFDCAGVGILVLDRKLRLQAYNPTAAQRFFPGETHPEGRHCYDVVCDRDTRSPNCTVEQALAAGEPVRREAWAHGDRRYDVYASPMRDAEGRITHFVLIYLDVSERLETLRALAESEERYRDLFENASDLIQSVRADGSFQYVNRTWLETLGYTEDEVAELTIFDILTPSCHEHCEQAIREAFAGADLGTVEAVFRAKDGREVQVEGKLNCRVDATGAPVATRAIFRDVTEARRLRDEINRAQRLESLGLLAGGIAHDFNNLLAAVLNNITLARLQLSPGDKAADRLQEAERAVTRAEGLTGQLLTFAKGSAPDRQVFCPDELVRETVGFTLSGSRINHEIRCTPDLPHISADRGQIAQVIQNLVLNAEQAMPAGGTLHLRLFGAPLPPSATPPGEGAPAGVCLEIRDEGIGIAPEHMERIFDPYFSTKQRGSGLGLSTVHSIIHKHGGHISVTSHLSRGTTFQVYLPAAPHPASAAQDSPEPELAGQGRILLMDDEEMILDAAGELLEMSGYQVERVQDGAEAVARYREAQARGEPFAAVIMDLTVPGGMGGREAVQKLLEIDPDVRAIASSGYSTDPVMADPGAFGFCAVMRKPYKIDALLKSLEQLLA